MGEMMILRYIFYFLLAYLSGEIMFGYWIPKIFCGLDVRELSKDGNPGTANAFTYAGPVWGMLVLICDVLKGFLPVHLAAGELGMEQMGFALIMAGPVIGHACPIQGGREKGGKGIAVTFGVLAGLYPFLDSLELLIFWYLLFSLVIIVNPHSLRTGVTYLCWLVSSILCKIHPSVAAGTFLISAVVLDKHKEELRHTEDRKISFIFRRN